MVVLNRIYTRTGDDGTTALGTGERRPKHDLRIEAYGTIDEANSAIGLARLETASDASCARIDAMLLCMPASTTLAREPLRMVQSQIDRLEREIDELNADLKPLRSFVLPGGSRASAALHLARAITRRAERVLVALAGTPGEAVGVPVIKYVNRLSDFLFVAARYLNSKGEADILWVPGRNR